MILSLLMGMIKHSQSTQINKFDICLQNPEKEVRNGVDFLHTDNQSTQKSKLVIFLQYFRKKVSQLLLLSIVMQNIYSMGV